MAERIREIEPIAPGIIYVGDRLRSVSEDAVARMAESLDALGLMNPILVRMVETMEINGEPVDGVPVLIAGATRLAAAQRLGWKRIDCIIAETDEVEARKREIAENLHRTELTVQERSDHVAEWARLTDISGQVAQKVGRPVGGVAAAARELGLERTEVRRAVKVASISERAKQAAVEAKLDNNQSALLKVASVTPAEQVERVRQLAAERDARAAAPRKPISPAPAVRNEFESYQAFLTKVVKLFDAVPEKWREDAIAHLGADTPVMDRGAA